MSELFTELHHVCIVVHDLDRAVSAYQQLGIGPWVDYPKGGRYVEYDVPNPAGSAGMRYKCHDFVNVQLQLCQPGPEDTPQRRFLDTYGEGVYHLGFEVPDLAAAVSTGEQLGLGIVAKGRREDGSGFCYFDTRDSHAVTLEVRHTSAPPASATDNG